MHARQSSIFVYLQIFVIALILGLTNLTIVQRPKNSAIQGNTGAATDSTTQQLTR